MPSHRDFDKVGWLGRLADQLCSQSWSKAGWAPLGQAATRRRETRAEGLGSGVGHQPRGRQSTEVVEVATTTWIEPIGREAEVGRGGGGDGAGDGSNEAEASVASVVRCV